ncbi:MAG: hypothetical protein R3E53_11765 [Myxococcota bacterium]
MARLPLWQVKQLSTMPVWSIVAGVQPFGVWHVSQVLPVGMWFVLLPAAVLPLWQLKQPSTMPASKDAGTQPFGVWQFSQVLFVGRWFVGFARDRVVVVAAEAVVHDAGMVEGRRRRPVLGRVAELAGIRRRDVGRRLARYQAVVVALEAAGTKMPT